MITDLNLIVTKVDTKNLSTIEQISQGYEHSTSFAMGDDNPKLFAWQFLYTDYLVEAAKNWKGQVVIDLGCGRQLDGYIIAKIAGAAAYIAVDPHNLSEFYKKLNDPEKSKGSEEFNKMVKETGERIQENLYDKKIIADIRSRITSHLQGKHIPISLISEDMLSALRRFPSESVSIMTAGLDRCIIWKDEYASLAEEEITRVLHSEGAYLAMCSRLSPKNLKKDPSFKDNSFSKFTRRLPNNK